uniref:3-oxoacyl-[acyl-carrier-protein] synthase I, chloroplastic n=3 Tax=Dunaliella tertiolecta TaxID=3047 RepID=A0A7S3QL33_DUNTE|mmetsp:Transcript_12124/g.33118  ORF Transcript_12124/g.33118 Transcript_12124/m.33118 type:complete len:471 (+) Transcript_12124:99-1511(+)|eukprot:CAMPEP_0202356462 /NCGR_PEP_ID=MMETSP1126-20121109/10914_1 /ASSEMBLY_ACC=CAM_ASM_000457 /TAXON_ID=3047 /ORGANISM="Dunaliella tertiolecta, Strain CCMP1320" /LENGTH=470 /DNA_ID=CAMNT_0048949217 /DNA_START=88 /DNA_END=1500 /DNA_ORIENTATION=+
MLLQGMHKGCLLQTRRVLPSQGGAPSAAASSIRASFSSRIVLRAVASQHAQGEEQPRRVVVTGMGVVSPLGHELDEFYNNLLAGKSGISLIENFDAGDLSTRFAGEIKELDASPYIIKKLEKRVDACIKYIMVSGKKALQDAGLDPEQDTIKDLDKARCGILIGSAMGGMTSFSNAVEALFTAGYRKMNPFCIPFAINNMGGAMLAMDVGFMGPNYSISTACATGNYCIHTAAEHVRRGDADLMLAGAADAAIIPSGMAGFIACKALSKRNEDPTRASRPWDVDRDGFVMGEGAGVLVLEEYEHARARGAKIYADWVGGAFSCDAHHMTEPHPEGRGVKQCINRALQSSGISPEQVDYVNAHATSTQAGDMAEYRALNDVFPQSSLRMNSTKSMIGHLLGGAGAVEAVATIKAIETGVLHPSINLENPESGIDLQRVCAGVKQQHKVDVALSNSFGFGGHNSCIIFRRHL